MKVQTGEEGGGSLNRVSEGCEPEALLLPPAEDRHAVVDTRQHLIGTS
jgi:hypothetical protein